MVIKGITLSMNISQLSLILKPNSSFKSPCVPYVYKYWEHRTLGTWVRNFGQFAILYWVCQLMTVMSSFYVFRHKRRWCTVNVRMIINLLAKVCSVFECRSFVNLLVGFKTIWGACEGSIIAWTQSLTSWLMLLKSSPKPQK